MSTFYRTSLLSNSLRIWKLSWSRHLNACVLGRYVCDFSYLRNIFVTPPSHFQCQCVLSSCEDINFLLGGYGDIFLQSYVSSAYQAASAIHRQVPDLNRGSLRFILCLGFRIVFQWDLQSACFSIKNWCYKLEFQLRRVTKLKVCSSRSNMSFWATVTNRYETRICFHFVYQSQHYLT